MHYKSKKHTVSALSAEEGETIEQLSRLAEKMEMRLSALEKILEAEDPKWKEKAL
jgi:phage shock protein B